MKRKKTRNLQVHLSEEIYAGLQQVGTKENITVSDIVRTGIMLYLIFLKFQVDGKKLFWEDTKTGEKIQLVIPELVAKSIF